MQDLLDNPETIFKKPEPEYPNYRKFKVNPDSPLTKFPNLTSKPDYGKIIKYPHAQYSYIYINTGNKKVSNISVKYVQKLSVKLPKFY